LRRLCKFESVALDAERPVALIQEEQRPGAADYEKILESIVIEVRE
jgi:hypothetical protein